MAINTDIKAFERLIVNTKKIIWNIYQFFNFKATFPRDMGYKFNV